MAVLPSISHRYCILYLIWCVEYIFFINQLSNSFDSLQHDSIPANLMPDNTNLYKRILSEAVRKGETAGEQRESLWYIHGAHIVIEK